MGIRKTLTVETVSPAQATIWLSKQNGFNRPVKKQIVTKYAGEMLRGGWMDNGIPIIFDEVGHILDGQHRLQAVVASGVTQEFIIVRGISVDAFTTFDVGAKRSFGDILAIEGYTDASNLSAVARAAWVVWKFGSPSGTDPGRQPSHADLLKLVKVRRSLMDANAYTRTEAFRAVSIHRPYLATAFDIAMETSPEDAQFFFERLASGAELASTSPILLLRNRLIQARADTQNRLPDRLTIWAITAKAWSAFLGGVEIKHLAWRRGGAKPESMPQFEGLEKWVDSINTLSSLRRDMQYAKLLSP